MNESLNKILRFFLLLGLVAMVGMLDYKTGYELQIGALYFIPVAYGTWQLGITTGIFISLLVTLTALWTEVAGGKVFSATWIIFVNSASRFSIFLFVALSFAYFRRTLSAAQRQMRAFAGPLPVCASCHRIEAGDGFWMDFPTYVQKNSAAVPEFRTCPLCVVVTHSACPPNSSP